MTDLPQNIAAAISQAEPEDEVRTAEGTILAKTPCARHCTGCEGEDHHWMPECDGVGEPLMVCKHCPAWREITDEDFIG